MLERAGFKNHVLNEWFGHSGVIAQEDYLQVTESDFDQAAGTLGQPSGSVAPLVAPSQGKQGPPRSITETQKPNKKRALMALATVLMFLKVHPIGFEPITLGSEDRCAIQLRHGCNLLPWIITRPCFSSTAFEICVFTRFYKDSRLTRELRTPCL